jgi:hypothetical protein
MTTTTMMTTMTTRMTKTMPLQTTTLLLRRRENGSFRCRLRYHHHPIPSHNLHHPLRFLG